jgi:dTDP-glucose 4,6-dehydratase
MTAPGGARRAIVTGGAGFVGSHLCDRLVEQGISVVCVDNLSTGRIENLAHLLDSPLFEFVDADVTEPFTVAGPADYVLHLASPASPMDYHRLPLETLRAGSAGTENALRLALEWNARFILASTSEVYGDPGEHPQRESYWGNVNPIGPRSVYDEGKRYAEALTSAYRRTFGVDTGIARLFNCYGPRMRRDDGRVIPTFLGQALAGEPLTVNGSGTQTRSLCFVDDTVGGLLALLFTSVSGPVNIGGSPELTVRDIAALIAREAGVELRVRHCPLPEDDPVRRCPDLEVARTQLGWKPGVSPEEGLRRTLTWWSHAHST